MIHRVYKAKTELRFKNHYFNRLERESKGQIVKWRASNVALLVVHIGLQVFSETVQWLSFESLCISCLLSFNIYKIYKFTWWELASASTLRALWVSCDACVRPHRRQLCWQGIAVLLAAQCGAGIWLAANLCVWNNCQMCYWKEQSEILIRSNSLVQTDSLGACSMADIAYNLSKYLLVFLGPREHPYISFSAKLLVYIFYSI